MSYIRWQSEACGCLFITFLSGGLFEEGKGWGHWIETYSSHNAVYCHNIIMVIILIPKFEIFMAKIIDKHVSEKTFILCTRTTGKKELGLPYLLAKCFLGIFQLQLLRNVLLGLTSVCLVTLLVTIVLFKIFHRVKKSRYSSRCSRGLVCCCKNWWFKFCKEVHLRSVYIIFQPFAFYFSISFTTLAVIKLFILRKSWKTKSANRKEKSDN